MGDGSARRQRAPLRRDALDRPPELDLGLEQPVAFAPVLAGLAWKADVRVSRQRGRVYARAREKQTSAGVKLLGSVRWPALPRTGTVALSE